MEYSVLEQHEAFLRAIFDDPDQDVHRLVYADFLEEGGLKDRAMVFRIGVEGKQHPDPTERGRLLATCNNYAMAVGWNPEVAEGLIYGHKATFRAGLLEPLPAVEIRTHIVTNTPHLFGTYRVEFSQGRITDSGFFDSLFGLQAMQKARELVLKGVTEDVEVPDSPEGIRLTEIKLTPRITLTGVEALAHHRGARKLEYLDLTHNDLDNDAARALVRSPVLNNLKTLNLLDGNRLRGRVWQQVVERFGADVAQ